MNNHLGEAYHMRFNQMERSGGTQAAETGFGAHHTRFSPIARPKPSCNAEKSAYMTREVPVTCDFATISLTPSVSDIPDPPHPQKYLMPTVRCR